MDLVAPQVGEWFRFVPGAGEPEPEPHAYADLTVLLAKMSFMCSAPSRISGLSWWR